jgi:hypothetical protein
LYAVVSTRGEWPAAPWIGLSFIILLALLQSVRESSVASYLAPRPGAATNTSHQGNLNNATDAGWSAGWSCGFFAAEGGRRAFDLIYWTNVGIVGTELGPPVVTASTDILGNGICALVFAASEILIGMYPGVQIARIKRWLGIGEGGD